MSAKLRIAWFSSPSVGSASAHIDAELLPRLSGKFEIERFSPHSTSSSDVVDAGYRPLPEALSSHAEKAFDLFFYQVEDLPACDLIRAHLLLVPGAVLYHDVWVVPREEDPALASLRGIDRMDNRSPFVSAEAERSWAAAFSCERDATDFSVQRGVAPPLSSYIPYPLGPVKGRARLAERGSGEELTLAFSGKPEIDSGAHSLLEALEEIPTPYFLHWLIEEDERDRVQRLLSRYGAASYQLHAGRTPSNWVELLLQSDIALHLSCSAYGDPGVLLPYTFREVVPAILSNFGASSYLPKEIAWYVEPGLDEAKELRELLLRFAAPDAPHAGEREKKLALASEYAAEFHDGEAVALEAEWFLSEAARKFSAETRQWIEREYSGLKQRVGRLEPEPGGGRD